MDDVRRDHFRAGIREFLNINLAHAYAYAYAYAFADAGDGASGDVENGDPLQ